MKLFLICFSLLVLAGCGTNLKHVRACDDPVGAYKHCRHIVTYETEPLCVGSCNPNVKSW